MLKTTISRNDVCRLIKPQSVVWRPMFVYNGVMMPELHRIAQRNDTDDPMLRIRLTGCGQDICEPVVSTDGRGMICFLKGNLPECWTHLTIMRSGKGGTTLMALPECLPNVDAYIAWRLKIASIYNAPAVRSERELAQMIADVPCPDLPVNRHRVQMFLDPTSDYITYEKEETTP